MWVDNVIKPVFLMMLYTRADHEGDFALHLTSVQKMMPYLFAANKHRYSRYGLFYMKSMAWLSPEIEKRFLEGEQTLHHQAGL